MFTSPQCSQCGMMHPPIKDGEICPNATQTTITGEEINYTELFSTLKTIIQSQIQNKKIKDTKKMFGNIIVNMTKLIEEYDEKPIKK